MKLLYICDALAIYGGIERVLIEKANWLVEHGGSEVCLLTVNQGNHPICFPLHPDISHDDLDIRFYQLYHFPIWKRPIIYHQLHCQFRERLSSKVKELTPDVIICTRLDYVCDVVRIKGVIPLVFESHSCRLACRFEGDGLLRRIHVWYLQLAVRKADMVVALTKGDAEEWRKLTSKVCVTPNVVHLNESETFSDCKSKSVIFVGRFSKQKDVGSLLQIWNLVHQRHRDWTLHIYGGYGEEQEAIFANIKQMNAGIQIHEPTSDIIEKYKQNSILLLTSRYEPFGLVIPEAMSCGLPVVAFDCPYGPAELITDGFDGYLIKNSNIEVFAERICQLIESEPLRQKMGKRAVESSQCYQRNEIMQKWMNLFSSFLDYSK